jgi:hypothetical protein
MEGCGRSFMSTEQLSQHHQVRNRSTSIDWLM